MFAPVAAPLIFSETEGGRHAFIHIFLQVLMLEKKTVELVSVLEIFQGCLCQLVNTYSYHLLKHGTSFHLPSVFFFFLCQAILKLRAVYMFVVLK